MQNKLYAKDLAAYPSYFYATRDDPAPLFTAAAFFGGQIKQISLEDYKGNWVVLFFYPSDFTFV
ncbi:alkyl hydroperoxide reductase [Bacillus sp. V3-13]|nr:alkyl hydroperoxide reductase [Bacillus sp. V3-13]